MSAFQKTFSIKLALALSFSGFFVVPAQAILSAVAGTTAYAALATAKTFAVGKVLGSIIKPVSEKVYEWHKPAVSLSDINKERFVIVTIPQHATTIKLSSLPFYVPQEFCGKKIQVDLAKLDVVRKLTLWSDDVRTSVAKHDQAVKFLKKCEDDIFAKVMELTAKQQDESSSKPSPYVAIGSLSYQVQALYCTSIITLIEAFRAMLVELQTDSACERDVIQRRDIKIMRSLCRIVVSPEKSSVTLSPPPVVEVVPSVAEKNSVSIATPYFTVQDHFKKIEEFKKEDGIAQFISIGAACTAAVSSFYVMLNYGQPLLVKLLQSSKMGTSLLQTCEGYTDVAKGTVGSMVAYIAQKLSLPRQSTTAESYGFKNHVINLLTTCTGIGASWWALHHQNEANKLFLRPKRGLIDQVKGFGSGMLHSVGSLCSSLWLNTLVNPQVRSASWPLWIHAWASIFYRPMPI